MIFVDFRAERRKGQGVTLRLGSILGGIRKERFDERLMNLLSVIRNTEPFQAFHSCIEDRLERILDIVFQEILNNGAATSKI